MQSWKGFRAVDFVRLDLAQTCYILRDLLSNLCSCVLGFTVFIHIWNVFISRVEQENAT